jgi:hypothetical protein
VSRFECRFQRRIGDYAVTGYREIPESRRDAIAQRA